MTATPAATSPAGPRTAASARSVEHHDLAGDLAGAQPRERVVEIDEVDPAAHELVELELAGAVEIDEAGDVVDRPRRSEVAAAQALLRDEPPRIDREQRALRHEPDNDRLPAGGRRAPRLANGLLGPERLESEVCAVLGQPLDGLDRVFVDRRDGGGRAELECELELLRPDVHRDDRLSARDPGRLDDCKPDAAAAPHGDAVSGRHTRGSGHGPVAGERRTADEARGVEWDVGPNRHGAGLGNDGVLREG